MTLCKNCKHYEHFAMTGPYSVCTALRGKEHPVLGTSIDSIDAGLSRMTVCGWHDPKLFEPMPEKKPPS